VSVHLQRWNSRKRAIARERATEAPRPVARVAAMTCCTGRNDDARAGYVTLPARITARVAASVIPSAPEVLVAYESFSISEVIPARPDQIYSAWLSTAEHSAFTGEEANVEPFVGGKHSTFGGYASGTNLELHPGRRIVQTWRSQDFPESSPDSRLEVTLEETMGGTLVTILQTEIPEGQSDRYREGWTRYYFEALKDYFDEADEDAGDEEGGDEEASDGEEAGGDTDVTGAPAMEDEGDEGDDEAESPAMAPPVRATNGESSHGSPPRRAARAKGKAEPVAKAKARPPVKTKTKTKTKAQAKARATAPAKAKAKTKTNAKAKAKANPKRQAKAAAPRGANGRGRAKRPATAAKRSARKAPARAKASKRPAAGGRGKRGRGRK
jgi:uncharacterized protein YndB with AHSA1/START domain